MPITIDQLRVAFGKLNGQRDVRIHFDSADSCKITGALLVPAEDDNIVKLTDGKREYFIDASRIAWVEIG